MQAVKLLFCALWPQMTQSQLCDMVSMHLITQSLVQHRLAVAFVTTNSVCDRSPASAESKSRTQQRNHDRAATKAYKGAMISEEW